MSNEWLRTLQRIVSAKPLIAFQFNDDDWSNLRESRYGVNQFTITKSHAVVSGARIPTACLLFGQGDAETEAYFGLVSSRAAVSTLESRIKIKRVQRIYPSSKADLLRLVTEQPYAATLRSRLTSDNSVIVLSPKLSAHFVKQLASVDKNRGSMRTVTASLSSPTRFHSMVTVQQDAVQTALRTFGLSADDRADSLDLVKGKETGLAQVNIVEDAVIERPFHSEVQHSTMVG